MRFTINLQPIGNKPVMPINYQYLFSSWVYKTISKADADFAEQLHNKGYSDGLRNFKLFSFSRLMVRKPKPQPQGRLTFAPAVFPVELSFYLDEIFRPFIMGLFSGAEGQVVDKYGGIDFSVQEIQRMPEPEWKPTMCFETLSPVHVNLRRDKNFIRHLSPFDADFKLAVFDNLVHKYNAAHPDSDITFELDDFRFELASNANKRRIIIKEHLPEATSLIGYDFKCRITAPAELMRIAYHAGLGKSNAMGLGLLREMKCGE